MIKFCFCFFFHTYRRTKEKFGKTINDWTKSINDNTFMFENVERERRMNQINLMMKYKIYVSNKFSWKYDSLMKKSG
jgi:hypothetical protein